MTRRRLAFLLMGGLAFLFTELGRFVYRPWVYSHGIHDYGLADSIGNLGGIVVQISLVLVVAGRTQERSFTWSVVIALGYVLYEFLQPLLPRGTFDWKDVVATGIGWVVTVAFVALIWKCIPNQENLGKENEGDASST